jgi:UDP-2,3-diacylglucosamine pyrophosphatase LpxH
MFTDKRLMNAYLGAQRLNYNKDSKLIFFSDLHRGDDSVSDEFARNQTLLLHALDNYYEQGYTYIEVGDGDELWEYKDFRYIRQAHGDVFTVLKKLYDDNRMILLYGNHNINMKSKYFVKNNYYKYYDEYQQKYFDLFPGLVPHEALVLKNKKGHEIFVVHGHQGDFMNDQFWRVSRFTLRYFWRYFHVVGFRNPASPARNLFKRHKVEKSYKRWIVRHKKVLICGHTHRPRFPKNSKVPYFNTGCGIHSKGITGIELVNEQLMMVDWRMRTESDGTMRMKRTVVRGPFTVERFYR